MTRRVSIDVDSASHRNPIPAACRMGPLLVSGLISGTDPDTGKLGKDLAEQSRYMFAQMRRILEAAGSSPESVVKVNVWMRDRNQRGAINPAWFEMFPDPHARPARQSMQAELEEGKLVQCDFLAFIT